MSSELPRIPQADFVFGDAERILRWHYRMDPVPWWIFKHIFDDKDLIKKVAAITLKHQVDVAKLQVQMLEELAGTIMR